MWGNIIAGSMGIIGLGSGMQAAKRQERVNIKNADLVRQSSAEEERRLRQDIFQSEALGGALSAASGVQTSGSREISIKDTKKENRAQLDWLMKSNVQKAKSVQAGGDLQVGQLKTQAVMSGLQGFSQLAGLFSKG